MRIDLQADMLPFEAEVVEEVGVLLGPQHVGLDRVDRRTLGTEHRPVRLALCDLASNDVRRHLRIGRHLDRNLSPIRQRGSPPSNDAGVIGNPLQARRRENDGIIIEVDPADASVAVTV